MQDVQRGWIVKNVMDGKKNNFIQVFIARINQLMLFKKINRNLTAILLLMEEDKKMNLLMFMIRKNHKWFWRKSVQILMENRIYKQLFKQFTIKVILKNSYMLQGLHSLKIIIRLEKLKLKAKKEIMEKENQIKKYRRLNKGAQWWQQKASQ